MCMHLTFFKWVLAVFHRVLVGSMARESFNREVKGSGEGAQAKEPKQRGLSKGAQAEELKQRSSSKGAQAKELKQRNSSKGA